jgi:hypothetical protein
LCEKYQTFLVPSGPDKHLYIVVTEADGDGMHILVNVTSIDPEIAHDKTCCFDGGEHKFIKKPSYAAYGFAIQRHANFVDQQVKLGNYIQHDDASEEVVAKIRSGLKKSVFTKRGIKDGYDAALRAEAKRKK